MTLIYQDKETEGIEEFSLLTRLIGKCMPTDNVPEILLASPNEENYEMCVLTFP